MKILFETTVHLPFEKIREGFNQELFIFLAPSLIPFRLKRFDGCKKNDLIQIELGPRPFSQQWVSHITFEETNASGWSFIDEGKVLPWPLKYWKHHHRVDRVSASESRIVDDIHYECSPAFLTPIMMPFLWLVFSVRPSRYQKFFKD